MEIGAWKPYVSVSPALERKAIRMKRLATAVLAILLILAGLAFIPLPIPIGALLVLAGTALLISCSTSFTRFIRFIRRSFSPLDVAFDRITTMLPATLNRLLKQTEP
jgi:hypothetical protein